MILSCSEKVVDTPLPNESDEIKFGTIATKGVDGIEDIDNFGVWISMTNVDGASDYVSYLSNERVYPADLSKNLWTYDKTRYWFEDCYFYFIASYPYAPYPDDYSGATENLGVGTFAVLEDTMNGVNRIAYSLNVDTYDEENKTHEGVDILTAFKQVNTSGPAAEWKKAVEMRFRHLLTKVNVIITQDVTSEVADPENHYYITNVSLQGVKTDGQYQITPNNDEENILYSWTYDNNTGSYEKAFEVTEDSKTLLQLGEVSVWGDEEDGGLLMIPQEIKPNSVKICIDYIYELAKDEEQNIQAKEAEIKRLEAYIPASDSWKSNNQITYTIAISSASKIVFLAPEVESWGTPQTGGTIIIQ